MKLTLFGANGMAGTCIAKEALQRGHELTAIVRNLSRFSLQHEHLTIIIGNVLDPVSVSELVQGQDAVISAAGPGATTANDPVLAQDIVKVAHALIKGLTHAGTCRLLVVGGAGSLEVSPGVQLVDTPGFPEQYRLASLAHREALAIYQACDLNWTFISPAAEFEPGERTGTFRTGTTQLLVDENGRSRISAEDYAIALLDEVEQPHGIRSQMTVAY